MKLLFCGNCFDIKAFSTEFTPCKCGNMEARWVDPERGTFEVRARVKQRARIIGMSNSMLRSAFNRPTHERPKTSAAWAELHKHATCAPGYIFDAAQRNCWACIIAPGETNDGGWAPDSQPYLETIVQDGYTAYVRECLESQEGFTEYEVQLFNPAWQELSTTRWRTVEIAKEMASALISGART